MSHKMLQPSRGTDIRDLIRLHGAEKSYGESASQQAEMYVPSQYEIKQIAKRIKDITGMEVSSINLKFISRQEAKEITYNEIYSEFKKSISDKNMLEDARQQAIQAANKIFDIPTSTGTIADNVITLPGITATPAFFSQTGHAVYIVRDNMEALFKRQCLAWRVDPSSEEGKRIARYLILGSTIHESLHKAVKENIPMVSNWFIDQIREQAKIHVELAGDEKAMEARWETVRDGIDARDAFDEGIAYWAERRIMSKFGYSYKAMRQVQLKEESEEKIIGLKGIKFLDYIEKRTGETPIKYTIKHPPLTMRHIEHPDEYLKDLKEGTV